MLVSSHGYCIKKHRSNLSMEIKEMYGLRDTMMKRYWPTGHIPTASPCTSDAVTIVDNCRRCSSLMTLKDKVLCDYTCLSAMDTETLDNKQREVAHAWYTSPSFIASMIPLSNGSIEELHDSLTLLDVG